VSSTQFDTEIDDMPTLLRRTVTTSYGDIAIAEIGEGPVLVMLHGGGPGASGVSNYHQAI
jgi:4,5:9,10-diseco-3-hydroxy-5,9,17-trioxoandrosta-1(10),2-diene-4-oate hydrolase